MFAARIVAVAGAVAALIESTAGAMPPGFQKVLVFRGLEEPVAFEFLPDGRPIVAQRWGSLVVINGSTKSKVLDIPDVEHSEEWGLLGLALDPDFQVNGFVYVYYTTASAGHICRVSRFTMQGDVANPLSEVVIWQNPQNCTGLSHHGGCIRFGPDGKLYIATGEEFESQYSQSLLSQRGKILRLNADGSAPPDNPFAGNAAADPLVWAYGLRNPFRFSFDQSTGRMYIGDVGEAEWEEIDQGLASHNYGWPFMQGPHCYVADCSPYTAPEWAYSHGEPDMGAAVILGPVCRSTAFPSSYRNHLVFADHVHGWVRFLPLDNDGHVTGDGFEFDRSPEMLWTVDLKFGPDGALYYTSVNDGVPAGQMLWKIQYIGSNVPPVPAIHAQPRSATEPPLTVQFSAAGSFDDDPNGPPAELTFVWDFGDGQSGSGITTSHEYTARGRYLATVTVSDDTLAATSKPLAITVGGPPQLQIDQPDEGALYRAGDTIPFSGSAFDPETGAMPPESLTWTAVLVHNTHTHPFVSGVTGFGGQMVIPDSGHGPEDTHYRISLTAIDADQIQTTVSRDVFPVESPISFASDPSGIAVFLDGVPLATPAVYRSVVNFNHVAEAQTVAYLDGSWYRFTGWSSGPDATIEFVAPEGGTSFTAYYEPVCLADFNRDSFVSGDDFDLFVEAFVFGDIDADIDGNSFVNGDDFDLFVEHFVVGC